MEEQEREDEDESGLECKSGASQCSRLSEAARSPANAPMRGEGEAAQTTDRTNAHSLPPASTSGSMEVQPVSVESVQVLSELQPSVKLCEL